MVLSRRGWWMVPILAILAAIWSPGAAFAVVSATPMQTVSFNGAVRAVAYVGDTIYVGGDFTAAYLNGKRDWRSHLAAINARTGALLPFAPETDGVVQAMAVDGDDLYVGGFFTTIDGQRRRHLARFNGGTLEPWQHSLSGAPREMAVANGRLYAAGTFSLADDVQRGNVAAWDLSSETLTSFNPVTDGTVHSIATGPGRIYLSGVFTTVNGSTARKLAAVRTDGTLDKDFAPKFSAAVFDVAVTRDRVYAATGGSGGRLVALDLYGEPRWQRTVDGDIQAVAILDGMIYAGGHFDHACSSDRTGDQGVCLDGSVQRGKFIAMDTSGQMSDWNPSADSTVGVWTLATNGRSLAAGGEFLTFGGTLKQRAFAQFRT